MKREQRRSLTSYSMEEKEILKLMANPKCGISMFNTLEIKLQKCRDSILNIIHPNPL